MDEKQTIENFLRTRTEEAFCALFESVYPRVCRYFRLRGMEPEEAEELAQNVMVKVYRQSSEIRDRARFTGWLFQIAKNERAQFWRTWQTRQRIAPMEPLSEELAATLRSEMEPLAHSRLAAWLSALEPAERDLVILRFVEELSYEELAAAFDIPVGTVKWRLFAVKKKLAPIISPLPAPNQRRLQ